MDHYSRWSHELELAAEPGSAAKARAFVREQLVHHRRPDLVEDVRLVVSELATNAVIHARTAFTVILEERAGSVLLTVRDRSPRPVLEAQATRRELAQGGRGLMMVASLSESWGVTRWQDDAKSVWASFDLRAPAFG